MSKHNAESPASTAALISYAVIIIFGATVGGVFFLIFHEVKIDPVMLTVLGSVITAVAAALTGVIAFWMGSSSGSKSANAALAQLAGAGPQPPAQPMTDPKVEP